MTQYFAQAAFTQYRYPVAPAPLRPYAFGLKRLLDVVLVLLLLPLALPLIALAAALAAADGHAPFFRQARIGRGGRLFFLLKIRTMVPDAEARLACHLATDPAAAAEWAHHQKLRRDPRITRFGRLLRQSSLDELPQLLNVLTGDMSLVGPRPMLPGQRPLYPGADYESLRPGITGLWQVSERAASGFADRARYDSAYARSLTLATDLAILARTAGAVIRQTGC